MIDCATYIHLPFCRGRCPYCDFTSNDVQVAPVDDYRSGLEQEWAARTAALDEWRLLSVYVGGGTPSLWPAPVLGALIRLVTRPGALAGTFAGEVTVEANPGDVDDDWFAELAGYHGVTRFSIGAQALDDDRLRWLGRRHDAATARQAIGAARRSGASAVSADLIFGTPGQRPPALVGEIRQLAEQGVDHFSAYELTVAPGTELARAVAAEEVRLPDDDQLAELWTVIGEAATDLGFHRYEVSSYARPGQRCRHNEHYWAGGFYFGLGAGAHGCLPDRAGRRVRYANSGDVDSYLAAARGCSADTLDGGLGRGQQSERVSDELHARERIMLGLRTVRGVVLDEVLAAVSRARAREWRRLVEQLVAAGLVEVVDGRLIPRPRGMLLADDLAERFF